MRVIKVRGHYRKTKHGPVWVFPSIRHIESRLRFEKVRRVKRDATTKDLFEPGAEDARNGGSDEQD